MLTTASWTHVYGDEQMMLIGNVQIDKFLEVMKEQLQIVRGKTKEIFDQEFGG